MDPKNTSPDIAPQVDHQLELDHLTGLLDRESFEAVLARESVNNPGAFAVVFIDLNGLKAINDGEGGHAAGDKFLQTAGEVISNNIRTENSSEYQDRPTDAFIFVAGRLGGDEFGLVLLGCKTQEDVETVMTRLKESFSAEDISASMGGRIHDVGEPVSELLADADKRMYADKQEYYGNKRALELANLLIERDTHLKNLTPEQRQSLTIHYAGIIALGIVPTGVELLENIKR